MSKKKFCAAGATSAEELTGEILTGESSSGESSPGENLTGESSPVESSPGENLTGESSPESELAMWRARAEAAERALSAREFDDAMARGLFGLEFSSLAARRYVEGRIREAGLPLSDGELDGLYELIGDICRDDPGVIVTRGQARFTEALGVDADEGVPDKKARIMAIRDREARRAAIAANLGLFQ